MNKKHSIMVGLLAGGLLLSTNTADAAMITGNSKTTSEANTSIMYQWQSPINVMYNYNLNNLDIQNLVNEQLNNLEPTIKKELLEAQKSLNTKTVQEDQKPVAKEKAPAAEKEKAPVVEKPAEKESTPVAEKPATPVNPATPVTTPEVKEPVKENTEAGQVSSVIQQVVDLTNQERAKAGLKALQIDTKLTQSAQAKSQDMKDKNYFSHTSPTYGSPFDQMKSFGITYNAAAENIAMGQRSAAEVVKAWMESPGHKANIMNPSYTHIGVGLSDSGYYWTQQFIGK
ncbi:CAP domain-containing protein [Psychrobacillus sp. NEAU-3TGS]|uniref:CAP domain-containing protein n=1 Tax=Psychrobacillus sp. NEAU-3TGS TaxID=2995412 RepID=UPI002497D2C5|nr:CAP domain-containing protein [Psychrobacillus sp. NEAU-3TGS]MDI2588983.1 CAP domain-containing protein [Psychrobacillus sp. NEAU-3TGS]